MPDVSHTPDPSPRIVRGNADLPPNAVASVELALRGSMAHATRLRSAEHVSVEGRQVSYLNDDAGRTMR
jgi:hypothetical protein